MRVLGLLSVCVCVGWAAAGAAWAPTVVFVGPGGCDITDPSCVPPAGAAGLSVRSFRAASPTSLEPLASTLVGGKPSWLIVSGSCLFATLTGGTHVASYAIDAASGRLALRSNVSLGGGYNPVFLDTLLAGKAVVVANYHGPDNGTVSTGAGITSLHRAPDCGLTAGDFLATAGHSVDPARQGASHVHSVVRVPAHSGPANVFFACDLGTDRVMTVSADPTTLKLSLLSVLHVRPGTGPRHLAGHPALPIMYLVQEMGNLVSVLAIAADHSLSLVEEHELIAPGFKGMSKSAEIVATPDGRYVMASTRGFGDGTNTVVLFRANAADGRLTLLQRADSLTRFPRGMELAPDGQTLFVAGQSSANIIGFTIANDALHPNGLNATGIATPTTLGFAPLS